MKPWHLRMSYNLFDMYGKARQSGTVEEWWVSPTRRHIVIDSPSLKQTFPAPPGQSSEVTRESYLVSLLLHGTVHPVFPYPERSGSTFHEDPRTFGTLSVTCEQVLNKTEVAEQFCIEPKNNRLRVIFGMQKYTVVRDTIARFANTEIALDQTITFDERNAIKGHIDLLEGFNPATTPLQETPRDTTAVTAPDLIDLVAPAYPSYAQANGLTGLVVMRETVSKEGKPTSFELIASTDTTFSQAVRAAVAQWRYKPMKRNGTPAPFNSIISVSFKPSESASLIPEGDVKIFDDYRDFGF